MFFGAKGGAGTTTLAVNCGVELARLSKRSTVIVDLKPGLGEVALFLGVRPRYSLLDAIDNLHRLDREFLKELVVKHKSGLEILAGSDQLRSAGRGRRRRRSKSCSGCSRGSTSTSSSTPAARSTPCAVAALYTADTIFLVANPDVPSVRNAQRLLDRVRQLGACGERVRVLLNRAAEPYPIPPKQIESALGHPIHHTFPSDYKTVSTALNSGVPLALAGNSRHRGAVRSASRGGSSTRTPAAAPAAAPQARPARPRAHRVHLVTSHEHPQPSVRRQSAVAGRARPRPQPPRAAVPRAARPTFTASC